MKVPVYEKQTSLRVQTAGAGQVARTVEQAFSQNSYTRLAQGLQAVAGAGSLLEALQQQVSRSDKANSSAVASPKAMPYPSAPKRENNAETLPSGAEKLLAGAVGQARQAANRRQKQDENDRQLSWAQALAPLASCAEELEQFMAKNFDSSADKNNLRARAVSNHLNASLAQGLTPQAAQVLARLGQYLTPKARQGAALRLAVSAGERAAQKALQQTIRQGNSPADWKDEDINRLTQEFTAHLPPDVVEETRQALHTAAGAERSRRQQHKAALLGQVLQYSRQNGRQKNLCQSLYSLAELFPGEEKTLNAAVRRIQSTPAQTSDRAVYNRLYKQVADKNFKEEKLAQEFSAGRLNGRDYILLMRERAGMEGGEDSCVRRLLLSSAERLCRKEGLSAEEAEEFKYAVFSQEGDNTSKLTALKKLRDVYFL